MPYADLIKRREKQPEYDRRRREKLGKEGVRKRNAQCYTSSGRNCHLKRTYGLTEQDVEWMKVEQGGQCAICFKDTSEKACADHNHATGKVRRLLCYKCNVRLSGLEDPDWKKAAEKYVRDNS